MKLITEIGIAAGEVWHYLDENGKSVLESVLTAVDQHRDIALMSVGWLAREGHVVLEGEWPNFEVYLRKEI